MALRFEATLSGGHPNSLGRTEEVVAEVLLDEASVIDLIDTYRSADPVVRLRTSSAVKRVAAAQPSWVLPHLDRLMDEVERLEQPSAQWTLAGLLLSFTADLSPAVRDRGLALMRDLLEHSDDWIVQNTTMETLARWAVDDPALADWLRPRLVAFTDSPRKSVAGRARKLLKVLEP